MDTSAPPDDATLFDQAACGLLVTDRQGHVLRANATACAWLGYTESELADGRRVTDLLPMGARLFYHTHCLPILQVQGSVAEIQVELHTKQRERLPMLLNIVRVDGADGCRDHWALFKAADRRAYERELVAARHLAEQALAARSDAENRLHDLNGQLSAADRRKDEFLATLSHELRNPLAPMRSALDMLTLTNGDARRQPEVLGMFDRQLRHLTRLVDDLMDISRITQGRMRVDHARIDLAVLIRTTAQDMDATLQAGHHRLTVEMDTGPVIVEGDATRLEQVIVNLLANAAKYTPDGGAIALTLRATPQAVELTVRDDGIGIPAESLGTIFDMFSQLTPAIERAQGGLGIGLALVRGVVELHGGTIRASSDGPGQGSTFHVTLPLAAPAADDDRSPPQACDGTVSLPILVVDDNLDAAEMLAMTLEVFGCDVRMAHTGQAALALAAQFKPVVAVLDIGLPDMTGFDLARRLRTANGSTQLTLIAVTGWGQEKDREMARDAGFDHHLTKPIDLATLRSLLPESPSAPRH